MRRPAWWATLFRPTRPIARRPAALTGLARLEDRTTPTATYIMPADYDGDFLGGKTDLVLWRPSTGTFTVRKSTTGATVTQQWGQSGDVPLDGDFDGDGKTDFAVWRPNFAVDPLNGLPYGQFRVRQSSNGQLRTVTFPYGGTQTPVVGDYGGGANGSPDGRSDFAIFRNGPENGPHTEFLAAYSSSPDGAPLDIEISFGNVGDVPISGDYDGDFKTDVAVYRPSNSTFYVVKSKGDNGPGGYDTVPFGTAGDVPVAGDYDGDYQTDYAVWRPDDDAAAFHWRPSNNGNHLPIQAQVLGRAGDIPVTGNTNTGGLVGDEKDDFVVWRPGAAGGGGYFVNKYSQETDTGKRLSAFGQAGDVPPNASWAAIAATVPPPPAPPAFIGAYEVDGHVSIHSVLLPNLSTFIGGSGDTLVGAMSGSGAARFGGKGLTINANLDTLPVTVVQAGSVNFGPLAVVNAPVHAEPRSRVAVAHGAVITGTTTLDDADMVAVGQTGSIVATNGSDVDVAAGSVVLGALSLSGSTLTGRGQVSGVVRDDGTGDARSRVRPASEFAVLAVGGLHLKATTDVVIPFGLGNSGEDIAGRFHVDGPVTLNGARLELEIPSGYSIAPGEVFMLAENDGTDAVSGTFAGLPEGAVFTVNGVRFVVSYVGGTGNDVVLIANRRPVAFAGTLTMNEDSLAAGGVLYGSDPDGDLPTYRLVRLPEHGTVTLEHTLIGTYRYVPNPDYFGPDSFTFERSDGLLVSDQATISLTVNPVNDAPSFTIGGPRTVLEDAGPQAVPGWATGLSVGPTNEGGQQLTFLVTTDNPGLFAAGPAVSPAGELTYTTAPDANGTATFTVRVRDDGGTDHGGVDTSPPQTVTLTVTPVNDAPGFADGPDQVRGISAGPQAVSGWVAAVSAGPPDEAGQTVSFEVVSVSDPGLFAVQPAVAPNGTLTYTPAPAVYGAAVVLVRPRDTGGTANGGVNVGPPQAFVVTVGDGRQPVAGAEVVANTDVSSGSGNSFYDPAIAADADGNYVVAWVGRPAAAPGTEPMGIYARRFTAAGVPLAPAFRVDTGTGAVYDPDVAMTPDGAFVVVWTRELGDYFDTSVQGRRYSAAGVPQGDEFRIDAGGAPTANRFPSVAVGGSGAFAVVYVIKQNYFVGDVVVVRHFAADGTPRGAEGRFGQRYGGNIEGLASAMDAAGNAVVTWSGSSQGAFFSVRAQLLHPDGTPRGGDFMVSEPDAAEAHYYPQVAMDADGDFVVAWSAYRSVTSPYLTTVVARRYTAAGQPLGNTFAVSVDVRGSIHGAISVAMDADGDFVVTWDTSGGSATDTLVYGQRFDRLGQRQGTEFVVSESDTGYGSRVYPDVAMDADGEFTVAWQDYVADVAIRARNYRFPTAAPVVSGLVVNGGAAQRSRVETLTVTFDGLVDLAPGAFSVVGVRPDGTPMTGTAVAFTTQVVNGRTVVTLTFSGPHTEGGDAARGVLPTLADGRWDLRIDPAGVTRGGLAMAGPYSSQAAGVRVWRLFGDTDGDGDVDAVDNLRFRLALRAGGYRADLDFDGDGDIDAVENLRFRQRLGTSLTP